MGAPITRRDFLAASGAGMLGLVEGKLDFGHYQLAIESYCFHDLDLQTTLSKTKSLGLKYIELHDGHLPRDSSDDHLAAAKGKLKTAGITAVSIYIHDAFSSDEAAARAIFGFAKKMGFRFINGGPRRESLPLLNRLIPEYQLGIAIHNHGPGSRYDKVEDVTSVLDRYDHLSACVDIGHFARSGVNPVRAIRTIGRRAVELHVKDIRENKENAVVGRGIIDMPAIFAALREIQFDGLLTLEYEGDWDNLNTRMEGMRQSLRNISRLISAKKGGAAYRLEKGAGPLGSNGQGYKFPNLYFSTM